MVEGGLAVSLHAQRTISSTVVPMMIFVYGMQETSLDLRYDRSVELLRATIEDEPLEFAVFAVVVAVVVVVWSTTYTGPNISCTSV